jgi:hypothetical protein
MVDGIRSPGWDLSLNVERAIKDGHPNPELLQDLAKVVAEEMDIKELDKYKEWRDA